MTTPHSSAEDHPGAAGPPRDPFDLFRRWFNAAVAAQDAVNPVEAATMTLSTVAQLPGGYWQPRSRVVLLGS